jgi:hypothetical protein
VTVPASEPPWGLTAANRVIGWLVTADDGDATRVTVPVPVWVKTVPELRLALASVAVIVGCPGLVEAVIWAL